MRSSENVGIAENISTFLFLSFFNYPPSGGMPFPCDSDHSERRLVIGFAIAAFIARCATVIQAINIELPMANRNMEALSGIWYA